MLQVKTEEQKKYIESILEKDDTCAEWGIDIDSEYENCLFIDDCITFDTMAKIVDYLRKENEEVEIPTTCRVSADSDGAVYDLRETPHNEVMQFCKKLAWVNGETFDHYYKQYVKTGKIRL